MFMKSLKKSTRVLLLIALVLVIDQSLKIWVKTNMAYGDMIQIFGLDWAMIHFVENNGMAFGMSLGGEYGKLLLSLFRIFAVVLLGFFIRQMIRQDVNFSVLLSFSLILAGALGNILDSAFYGMLFTASEYHGGNISTLNPADSYSTFLHGKVVDIFYFPIYDGYYPSWVPFLGGKPLILFKPVFNVADVAISIGVLNILIFQRSFFRSDKEEETTEEQDTSAEVDVEASEAEEIHSSRYRDDEKGVDQPNSNRWNPK